MDVYIDDMLVKSPTIKQHIQDLAKTFSTFRMYNMNLNLKKCIFKVKVRKLLGFMVSQKDIEAN